MATASSASTPNPNAMKFTVEHHFDDMVNVTDPAAASDHPLSEALFALPGVVGVFATNDFVTVSKAPEADWAELEPRVVEVLAVAL